MPTIYNLKSRFQNLLRPLTRWMASRGVAANQVTIGAALLSIATGSWLALRPGSRAPLLCVPLVLFVRMALNAIDGMLAREHDMKSDLGAFLNELGDVVSDAALYLPLALVPGFDPVLVVLTVILAIIGELAGVTATLVGRERRYDGPMGKSDRAFVFGALALAAGLGIPGGIWVTVALSAINLLAVVTIVNRVRNGLRTVPSRDHREPERMESTMPTMGTLPAPDAVRTCQEYHFTTSDGTVLFYRAWAPQQPSDKAVVLFHRGHEHSARWQDFIDRSDLADFWFFAWDARGHGRSPGERGAAPSFARMVQDADEFVRHILRTHQIPAENMAVVGQSVGAVLAATWVHDYAPPIRALVLATPALRIKLYVPLAIPGLRLLKMLRPRAFIRSYVKPWLLTHDAEQAALYAADREISPQIAVNILLDLHDASTRLVEDAGAVETPVLMLVSGNDWVVKTGPQRRLFERLSSRVKEWTLYPEFFHSTFWERDRDQPIARTRQFILERFASPPDHADLTRADRSGFTRDVCDRLTMPLPLVSFKRAWFAVYRLFMQSLGKLSRGIRIGWQTGFDSGESLDHVYRHKAEGATPLGRLIDYFYLESPGWRGIRARKGHLMQLLDQAISQVHRRQSAVQVMDIAAGPGRYVLETIARHPQIEISARLCDRDPGGLEAGRQLAASLGVRTATYCQHDAFDGDALAAVSPRPDIAIVSGLYELFSENDRVRNSLDGLGRAVAPGGFLIYTNQPWHPQQEMIARVLPNRDGEPWIMRCRTQAEIDQFVAAAGFEKIEMLIDEAGIFTVSLAVKKPV
ncbi:MAG: class I SAM-dependent methyltransferase family protein [Planctomycetia bacterium]|nr:class I SAM-dependent methyltransferase family protein [Planctomycetia bacterium]